MDRVAKPEFGPEWQLRFQIQFLFPKVGGGWNIGRMEYWNNEHWKIGTSFHHSTIPPFRVFTFHHSISPGLST
jgi:hypothetical protein